MRELRLLAAVSVSIAICFVCTSCGSGESKRYRVYGDAKYNGQPIAYGDVLFTPNASKKNSGPQGIAQIRNGKFDTSNPTGKAVGEGFAGGPTIVRVTGFSSPDGKGLICEYEYEVDLPQAEVEHHLQPPPKDHNPARPEI